MVSTAKKTKIQVWDVPTRLFHWGLVISVLYSWFSVKILEDMQQHFYAGYAVLTLLLFRIIWGFVGSHYSRFNAFLFSPSKIFTYLKTLFSSGKAQQERLIYPGHNPAGGLSALIMILVLTLQAALGMFSTDDYFYGPLAGLVGSDQRAWLSSLHLDNVNIIYGLLGLHLLAIIFYKWIKKEPLTKAMITGGKDVDGNSADDESTQHKKTAGNLVALAVFTVCIALVCYLANAYLDLLPAGEFDYF